MRHDPENDCISLLFLCEYDGQRGSDPKSPYKIQSVIDTLYKSTNENRIWNLFLVDVLVYMYYKYTVGS